MAELTELAKLSILECCILFEEGHGAKWLRNFIRDHLIDEAKRMFGELHGITYDSQGKQVSYSVSGAKAAKKQQMKLLKSTESAIQQPPHPFYNCVN